MNGFWLWMIATSGFAITYALLEMAAALYKIARELRRKDGGE